MTIYNQGYQAGIEGDNFCPFDDSDHSQDCEDWWTGYWDGVDERIKNSYLTVWVS